MNESYKNINSKYSVILFSPYLDEDNYEKNPNKHKEASEQFKKLGFEILYLKDNDKTLFIYHRKQDREYVWEKALMMARKYEVAIFFIEIKGLENNNHPSIEQILSVDYDNDL